VDKAKVKRKIGIFIDIIMFALLAAQMLYIFTGNIAHEIMGIAFFISLVGHIIIKSSWIKALIKGKIKIDSKARVFSTIVTILIFLCIIALALSSMGVSRFLFPDITFLGYTDLHRYLATAVLTLAVVHGGMHGYFKARKKKKAVVLICLGAVLSMVIGLVAVPYINRHFRKVDVNYSQAVEGEKINTGSKKPLVVYFTWLENSQVSQDADAVSGASLLRADGKLMGSNQLIADMLTDMLSCPKASITVTGDKYPGTYSKTVSAAGDELKEKARPDIEKIDVSGYDSIILVYPLWWGNIPMSVASFLEGAQTKGSDIYLVATQGSTGYGSSVKEIKELAEGADVHEVVSIYCEDIPKARKVLFEKFKEIYKD